MIPLSEPRKCYALKPFGSSTLLRITVKIKFNPARKRKFSYEDVRVLVEGRCRVFILLDLLHFGTASPLQRDSAWYTGTPQLIAVYFYLFYLF